jgi:hypothetical protein
MLFYHNSNQLLDKLIPKTGTARHGGEDPRAVSNAVVWLSNQPQLDDPPTKYRYVVDIDEKKPSLCMDNPFDQMQNQFNKIFPNINTWRWFFCFDELEILERYEYDIQQKVYKLISK